VGGGRPGDGAGCVVGGVVVPPALGPTRRHGCS
jgi:hypothetical protein